MIFSKFSSTVKISHFTKCLLPHFSDYSIKLLSKINLKNGHWTVTLYTHNLTACWCRRHLNVILWLESFESASLIKSKSLSYKRLACLFSINAFYLKFSWLVLKLFFHSPNQIQCIFIQKQIVTAMDVTNATFVHWKCRSSLCRGSNLIRRQTASFINYFLCSDASQNTHPAAKWR